MDSADHFVRLESPDTRFAPYDVLAYEGVISVEDEAAKDLMLDPLPLLASAIPEVGDDWEVTIHRVDAQFGFWWPKTGGPHHLCVLVMALPRFSRVHCLVHRFPPDQQVSEG
jgi:hypothetical protein